jgi:hypothetical protein
MVDPYAKTTAVTHEYGGVPDSLNTGSKPDTVDTATPATGAYGAVSLAAHDTPTGDYSSGTLVRCIRACG